MHRLTRNRFIHCGCLVLAVLLAVPATGYAYSNEEHWLEVHVIDRQTAQPLRDASVCLGTSARPDQFGSRRTDHKGIVRFQDLLPNPLVLSVSRKGFRSQQRAVEPMYQSRIMVLKLASGGGGPECHALPLQKPVPLAASGITIRHATVRRDDTASSAREVIIDVTVNGKAGQIRIGERADLSGSEWQDLQGRTPYTLSGDHVTRLYVQVRRKLEAEGATIEEVSPVRQVQFRL